MQKDLKIVKRTVDLFNALQGQTLSWLLEEFISRLADSHGVYLTASIQKCRDLLLYITGKLLCMSLITLTIRKCSIIVLSISMPYVLLFFFFFLHSHTMSNAINTDKIYSSL